MNGLPSCRAASKTDLSEILRLYAQPDLDDGKVLSVSEAECIFERMTRYPDYTIYVAVCDGQIVGTFALLVMDNLGHLGTPSAVIDDVAVDPAWQGRGVGNMMINYALEAARQKGCYKAALSSNLKRERAHAFYESLGFERHGYSFRVNTLTRLIPPIIRLLDSRIHQLRWRDGFFLAFPAALRGCLTDFATTRFMTVFLTIVIDSLANAIDLYPVAPGQPCHLTVCSSTTMC